MTEYIIIFTATDEIGSRVRRFTGTTEQVKSLMLSFLKDVKHHQPDLKRCTNTVNEVIETNDSRLTAFAEFTNKRVDVTAIPEALIPRVR